MFAKKPLHSALKGGNIFFFSQRWNTKMVLMPSTASHREAVPHSTVGIHRLLILRLRCARRAILIKRTSIIPEKDLSRNIKRRKGSICRRTAEQTSCSSFFVARSYERYGFTARKRSSKLLPPLPHTAKCTWSNRNCEI